jgi:molybdopterin synthase sulfur carrier subunit
VKILYFAQLAETLGKTSEELTLGADVPDVASLLARLRQRGPSWEETLSEGRVRVLRNRALADPRTALQDADEIALVPIRT